MTERPRKAIAIATAALVVVASSAAVSVTFAAVVCGSSLPAPASAGAYEYALHAAHPDSQDLRYDGSVTINHVQRGDGVWHIQGSGTAEGKAFDIAIRFHEDQEIDQ